MTQQDVTAFTDRSSPGGDWELERTTGAVETDPLSWPWLLIDLANRAPGRAPAEALDATFSGDGKLTADFGGGDDHGRSVALQADGKVLVAGYVGGRSSGDFLLARWNLDGTLDSSFDSDGKVVTDLGGVDQGHALAVQADGKILIAGTSNGNFALVRYGANGGLDSGFDGDGKVITDLGATDIGRSLVIQSDGKILLAGDSGTGTANNLSLVRYLPDGRLDLSFDGDGKVTTDLGAIESGYAVALQPDGKILLGGGSGGSFALARYLADGSLDSAFSGDGKLTASFGTYSAAISRVIVQRDGKILVAGTHYEPGLNSIALARYLADGSPDTAFSGDGQLTYRIDPLRDNYAGGLAVQPDGKILVGGYVDNGTNADFALARLNSDGSVDASFDGDGAFVTAFGSGDDTGSAIALGPDGRLYLAGSSDNGGHWDVALGRYWPGLLDPAATEDRPFVWQIPDSAFSDPDGDPLILSASLAGGQALPAWLGFDPATRTFQGTPGNGGVGSLEVRITATDPGGLSASDTVTLTVWNVNDAPTLKKPIADRTATEDAPFVWTVPATTFRDVDVGDTLVLTATRADGSALPAWLGFDPATRTFRGTPRNADVGSLKVRVTATDSGGLSASDAFTLRVLNTNDAPRLAPAGTLDRSFAGDGTLVTDLGASVQVTSLALQADGRILVAGFGADFVLARYTADGRLDSGFSGDGKLATDFSGGTDYAWGLAVQADGRILVAGHADGQIALARYTVAGTLDPGFGVGGQVTGAVGGRDSFGRGVLVQADGRVLVAGDVALSYQDFSLSRFDASGRLDTGFDGDGHVVTGVSTFAGQVILNYNDYVTCAVLQPDGKVLLAGYSGNERTDGFWIDGTYYPGIPTNNNFALLRLRADGGLDPGFSGDGRLTTELGSNDDRAYGIALQPDGRIILAGYKQGAGGYDYAVTRYRADGSLDASFDGDGKLSTDLGAKDFGRGVAVQADGKILVVGTDHLLRYRSDGSLDTGFAGTGHLALGMAGRALAVQPDGRIVVAGTANGDIALARYLPGGLPDQRARVGSAFRLKVPGGTFVDPDGDALTYSARLASGSALPPWLSFDAATRTLRGTPGAGDTGVLQIRIQARDPAGLTASDTFALTIVQPAGRLLAGTPGPETLTGDAGPDTLRGGKHADTLAGQGGADRLEGGPGDDSLRGGMGDDVLVGGPGNDTLSGGTGADRFRFVLSDDGRDTITDFSRADRDRMVFVSRNFGDLPPGALQGAAFVANATGQAGDADDRFVFETDARILWYDGDGNGAGITPVALAKLNVAELGRGDLWIAAS